jgi:hypothetical protein
MDSTTIVAPTWLIICTIATLTLAVAAFVNIHKTGVTQKQERKQRLLNEILQWAREVLECGRSAPSTDRLKDVLYMAKSKSRYLLF